MGEPAFADGLSAYDPDALREARREQDEMLRDEEDAAREAQAEREYWQGFSHFVKPPGMNSRLRPSARRAAFPRGVSRLAAAGAHNFTANSQGQRE